MLPAPIIAQHALALFGRQLLEALITLDDLIAPLGRERAEAAVGLTQFLPLRFGKTSPAPQRLERLPAFLGREAAKLLEVALGEAALLGGQLLPAAIVFKYPCALLGG